MEASPAASAAAAGVGGMRVQQRRKDKGDKAPSSDGEEAKFGHGNAVKRRTEQEVEVVVRWNQGGVGGVVEAILEDAVGVVEANVVVGMNGCVVTPVDPIVVGSDFAMETARRKTQT